MPFDNLKPKHKAFAEAYILDWNGTRAYKDAYPGVADSTAKVNASKLLTNANIQAYIEYIQKDLEKIAGISRLRIIKEHLNIINTSIAHLHNTWIERKEFDALTQEQKSAIAELSYQTRTERIDKGTKDEALIDVEYVKIKLYDRQKSMDSLTKILGYNEAEKLELSGGIKSYKIVPASSRNRTND